MADVNTLPARDQIGRLWRSYRINTLPARCSQVQERETRRAFYAGALAAVSSLNAAAESDMPEDQQVERLEAMVQELHEFNKLVVSGRG